MDQIYTDTLLLEEDPDIEDSAPEQEDEIIEEKLMQENIDSSIKLDYHLKTCEERAALVNRIIEQTPSDHLTNRYLEILGDYIMGAITKEEKKSHLYLTDNRKITVNKRETSFEGLSEKFENGEDGIYNLITNDKNVILTPKIAITQEDIETIPGLKELREEIDAIEKASKEAVGKKKYLLKKQLIEMRRDQYVLKSIFKPTMTLNTSQKGLNKIDLSERRWIDKDGNPQSDGLISFFNPKHISAILCNYNALKLETRGHYQDDFYYLMEDFDQLLSKALKNYPVYKDIVQQKVDNKTNIEIQNWLIQKHKAPYSVQYISSLWRNKIPKIIAEYAENIFLIQYYTELGDSQMKRCACCKELKPANSRFFSKNKTSKDGWYSWCKECRNLKNKGKN